MMEVQRPKSPSRAEQSVAPKRKRADTSNSSTECITTNNKRQRFTSSLCLASSDDAKVLSVIETRYEVQLQSVISSSKIHQRVSAILRHLTPSTTPSSSEPAPTATTSKTRVSVLRAKAAEAGKLISIAEIAKREIGKKLSSNGEGDKKTGREDEAGRWFQYIILGEERRQRKRDEGNTIVVETILGSSDANDQDAEDGEFEVMKTPFERAIEGQPLVRGVPVMSLFLSRSPIEELKRRYGEQTNATST